MNLDTVVVFSYFIIVLFVGWLAGQGMKNFRQYALGDSHFSSSVITIAIIATLIGAGSTIAAAENFFSAGIVFFVAVFGSIVRDFLVAIFIVPRICKVKNCYTVGDIMFRFHGTIGKMLAGLAGCISCAVALGLQITAIGYLSTYFLGWPYYVGVLAGAGVVVLYSSFGGMRSVTITDIIQFQFAAVTVLLLALVALMYVGGIDGLIARSMPNHLTLDPFQNANLKYYSMFFVFLFSVLDPALVQRLIINRDQAKVKKALIKASLLYIPHFLAMAVLGMVAAILKPDLDAPLALPFLINTLLPVGAKGLAVAGIMAILMSTADSFLHMAGVMFTNDLVEPILKRPLSEQQKLFLARMATFLIGAISITVALKMNNMYDILLFSYACWTPCISVPLLCGILGFRTSTNTFLASSAIGLVSYLSWDHWVYPHLPIEAIAPAFVISAVTYFIGYFFEKAREPAKDPHRHALNFDEKLAQQ